MAKIALRAYHREIEGLIESNQSDEALAHCRYILQNFPKYLETYRLMGKVFLENQRYGEASDVFQRVLSAMPDDFVSHVGMSIIREDEGNMDSAIWHMERSFEVQPYNSAIQGELRRLYGRRDGLEPSKVRLTRGALARMYLKGGLHHQAVAELRAALAEDNQRPDLQVLLASAYFQAGQRVEAVEGCSSLLKKLPYCFEANRILACILPETERASDADVYRQRVVTLDPYYINLKLTALNSDSVPDQAIVIDRLVWQVGDNAKSIDASQPAWARNIGVSFKDEEALPDWLTEGGEAAPAAEETPSSFQQTSPFSWDEVSEETAAAAEMTTEEIPDWMREAGWASSTGEFKEEPVDYDTPLEEAAPADSEIVPGDVPEWLRGMAPEGALEQEKDLPPHEDVIPWLQEETPGSSDTVANWLEDMDDKSATASKQTPTEAGDVPDWLQDLAPAQPGIDSLISSSETAEVPDWLQGLAAEQATEIGTGEASSESSGMPDWLQELAPSSADKEMSTEFPDWMQGDAQAEEQAEALGSSSSITDQGVSEPLGEGVIAPTDDGELPSWMQSFETDDFTPAQTAQLGGSDIPDWLKEMQTEQPTNEAIELPLTESPSEIASPIIDDGQEPISGDAADWLTEISAETSSPIREGDAGLDWLQEFSSPDEGKGLPSDEAALPDWLTSTETVEPIAESTPEDQPSEGIPDWLTSLETGEVSASEPVAETPVEAPAGELPDFSDEAAAMAWLEGLAAKQGVSDDELFMSADQHPSASEQDLPPAEVIGEDGVPAWLLEVAAEIPADAVESPVPIPSEIESSDAVPEWLGTTPSEEQPSGVTGFLETLTPKTTEPGETAPAPEFDEAAAMAWLDSLQEGGLSEDALLSNPEEKSAWLPADQTKVIEEPAVEAELPEWLSQVETKADDFDAMQIVQPDDAIELAPLSEELPAAETPAVEASTPEIPDLSDEAAAMAWLESLAAKQGISEDELFTSPEERPTTTPAWIEADAAEAVTETQATVTPEVFEESAIEAELPDWLSQVEAEADAFDLMQAVETTDAIELAPLSEELPVAETPAVEASTPEMPDLSDEAAAMAWLESLAAKQGISEDELFTSPEERPTATPAWIEADAAEAVSATQTAPVPSEEPAAEADLPDWLSQVEAEAEAFEAKQVEQPVDGAKPVSVIEEPSAVEGITPEIPDLSDEAAAMAWLESLAAKQGISEEELFTSPEERPTTIPAWIEADAAEAVAETQVTVTPEVFEEPTVGAKLPDWLSEIETEPEEAIIIPADATSEVPSDEMETEASSIQQELPEWLAGIAEETLDDAIETTVQLTPTQLASKSETPAEEIVEPPAIQPILTWEEPTRVTSRTEFAEAMEQTQAPHPAEAKEPSMDVNDASLVELEALPGIGFILAQNIINYRETYGPFSELDDLQKVSGVGPATVDELRQWLRVKPPKASTQTAPISMAIGGVLEEARVHLAQNDPAKASQIYSQLLRAGHPVGEIISDLQNALNRYPVDIALWQTMGEAYLTNDQLEEALESYTKAEELLR